LKKWWCQSRYFEQTVDRIDNPKSEDVAQFLTQTLDELPASYEDWKKKIIKIDGLHRRMKMWDTPGPRPAYQPLPTPPHQTQWNPP
jgi:hypothetical protein